MSPPTYERGPAAREAPLSNLMTAADQGTDHGHDSAPAQHVISVSALAFRPSGRRRGWLWLVRRCPYCSVDGAASAHAHRGGPVGGLRTAGCGRGEYVLIRVAAGWAA